MNKNISLFVVLVLFTASASAHHGTGGQFDQSKSLEVSGTVTKIRFVNPHSYVYFDATNESGEVENWRCEMRAATALKRSGWTKEMFASGTKIKIIGVPAFREPTGCYVNTVEFEDGEVVERYAQLSDELDNSALKRPVRLASGEPNISGDWATPQRRPTEAQVRAIALGMGMGPATPGRRATYEPSDAGKATMEGYQREDNPRFACEATNIVFDWTFDQHINRIVQNGDSISLAYGFMDIVRTLHLNMSEHPENIEPSRSGHSIANWEGDTLVVDTIGFMPGYLDSRSGLQHSDQLHVIERFTLDPSGNKLTREYSGTDPLNLAAEFSGYDIVYPSGTIFDPYNCEDLTEEVVEGF